MSSKLINVILPFIYLGASLPIFNKIYNTTKSVIDEEFHLRQGLHYCNKRFFEWDPKITTFPGLYIASCIVIPFNLCDVFGLRLVCLISSAFNVYIIFKIRERKKTQSNTITLAMESISIGILPPMYLFSHLYYTDILSMTFFLYLYYFWDTKHHGIAAIFAGLSVLVRQTNVVWIVLFLGTSFLDELIDMYAYRKGIKKKSTISIFNVKTVCDISRSWGVILQSVVNTLKNFYGYIIVVVVFVAFVTANGSVAVGDKNAHEITVHIPQLFYFGLFTLVFGAPSLSGKVKENLLKMIRSWKMFAVGSLVIGVIVGWNTLAHPYLLADNRHYTFYIWNRFYGKYEWFKFTIVPLYMFAFQMIQTSLSHLSSGFKMMFWISTFTALCAQKLLEVRYFLIPFMIIRLNLRTWKRSHIIGEFMYNVIINAITLTIFFNKEIFWSNYIEPQRIIW